MVEETRLQADDVTWARYPAWRYPEWSEEESSMRKFLFVLAAVMLFAAGSAQAADVQYVLQTPGRN